ncbi:hypothetical protein Pcinc_040159 [Petrolisthes cinctipes]|uniref:Uncharacterized protein n=1 Tax=Petrolisthes cinctipes TaxID=88211 RepID=A0AAE1BMH1_PETCI|nr:hypothetical protein Pcinc_040159 [Petrolisthes cinctipes]
MIVRTTDESFDLYFKRHWEKTDNPQDEVCRDEFYYDYRKFCRRYFFPCASQMYVHMTLEKKGVYGLHRNEGLVGRWPLYVYVGIKFRVCSTPLTPLYASPSSSLLSSFQYPSQFSISNPSFFIPTPSHSTYSLSAPISFIPPHRHPCCDPVLPPDPSRPRRRQFPTYPIFPATVPSEIHSQTPALPPPPTSFRSAFPISIPPKFSSKSFVSTSASPHPMFPISIPPEYRSSSYVPLPPASEQPTFPVFVPPEIRSHSTQDSPPPSSFKPVFPIFPPKIRST